MATFIVPVVKPDLCPVAQRRPANPSRSKKRPAARRQPSVTWCNEVHVSQRLVDSPDLLAAKHDFEINPAHPIIARLDATRQKNTAMASSVAEQLLDTARFAAGLLEDPSAMVARLNSLLEKVLATEQ